MSVFPYLAGGPRQHNRRTRRRGFLTMGIPGSPPRSAFGSCARFFRSGWERRIWSKFFFRSGSCPRPKTCWSSGNRFRRCSRGSTVKPPRSKPGMPAFKDQIMALGGGGGELGCRFHNPTFIVPSVLPEKKSIAWWRQAAPWRPPNAGNRYCFPAMNRPRGGGAKENLLLPAGPPSQNSRTRYHHPKNSEAASPVFKRLGHPAIEPTSNRLSPSQARPSVKFKSCTFSRATNPVNSAV